MVTLVGVFQFFCACLEAKTAELLREQSAQVINVDHIRVENVDKTKI